MFWTRKIIDRLRLIAVLLLFLLGLAAIGIGFISERSDAINSGLSISMLSVGGAALFGASLTMLIEYLLGTETSDIREYLLAVERFDSAPDHLTEIAGVWHVYYLSKCESGRVWKYVKYTLYLAQHGHSLAGAFQVNDVLGRKHTYSLSAGIRGDSLIVFSRPKKGKEPDSVEIVFHITADHLPSYLGIQRLITWDGSQALSYSIFTRDPLVDKPSIDPEDFEALDAELERLIERERLIDLRKLIT